MRIVQITAGTGDFYCGSCIRDNALVLELRRRGHDAVLVPLYLPSMIDIPDASEGTPLFFGGINVYLQQKAALFRKTPRWLDRLLDSTALLRLATRAAGMTSAKELGELTLSMLQGEEGKQVKELERMAAWLKQSTSPDIICLSNALLAGSVHRLKSVLGAPVVCVLQGEDWFLDGLPEPERTQAWELLAERCRDIDAFISVSHYFARVMVDRLNLPKDKVYVIHNGIDQTGFFPADQPPNPPVLGYLARLSPEKGLAALAEAYIHLKHKLHHSDLRMHVAGTMNHTHKPFVARIQKRLEEAGVFGDVELAPNLTRKEKQIFLRRLSVFSVPAEYGEAFGLYILEALASGVPVVQPNHGAFPELIEATGGGILSVRDDPVSLAQSIDRLLRNPDEASRLGQSGMKAVTERFSLGRMADQVLDLFQRMVDK